MGELRYRDPVTSTWLPIPVVGAMGPSGATGPAGPTGPTGTMGVSTIIVGSFGSGTGTPATLPPTGALPAGWTAPGSPAYQMQVGESLYYEAPTGAADPLDGHLFQYMTTVVNAAGWVDIGLIQGPQGPAGPLGPTGVTGPMSDEVHVGPDAPTAPAAELWYDTDDNRIIGPAEIPPGGTADQALVKNTDIDGDVKWAGPHVPYNVPAGKKIQFTNEEGPKINLYGSTFGLGITASTLALYTGGVFRFRRDSTTGTEYAWIDSSGMGPRTTYTVTYQNGFSGTMDFRVNPVMVTMRITNLSRNVNTDTGVQTKVCDYPSGVPAPPNIGAGYRVLAHERNDNFTMDNAARFVTIHLDSTSVSIIPTGDIFYSGKKLDVMVTWSR